MQAADRLSHIQEYYFSQKLREVAQMRQNGIDVINLGIGSPDLAPPQEVIEILQASAAQSDVHTYQPYQGIPAFGQAVHQFYATHYQVHLPLQVLPAMGSKEAITHISLAYLNPSDRVLIPELGYPTYTSVTKMVGATPVYYPLQENQNWDPDWSFFEQLDWNGIKLIWINYPHMPTGATASQAVLGKWVKLARRKGVLLVHDNPYSFILHDHPLSIFNIPGADEVAIELNSLSKSFNMAGWRVGWSMGAPVLIDPVLKIKSNMDSGMFKPIQLAAIAAMEQPKAWFENLNQTYRQRQEAVFALVQKLGCSCHQAQSGLFVWAKCPDKTDGLHLADKLLHENGIFITPGEIFGEAGKKFVRVSLCSPVEIIHKAMERL